MNTISKYLSLPKWIFLQVNKCNILIDKRNYSCLNLVPSQSINILNFMFERIVTHTKMYAYIRILQTIVRTDRYSSVLKKMAKNRFTVDI